MTVKYPKAPTNKKSSQALDAPTAIKVSEERWHEFKKRRMVKLWIAAALTMNLDPVTNEKTFKAGLSTQQLNEYKLRRKILISNYGQEHGIIKVDSLDAGSGNGGQVVNLTDVLQFAEESGWDDSESLTAMRKGLGLDVSNQPDDAPINLPPQETGKGEDYRSVRLGALLSLVEAWAKGLKTRPPSLLNGGELNISQLSKLLENEVLQRAEKNGYPNIKLHSDEAIRKQLADDLDLFKSIGLKTKK